MYGNFDNKAVRISADHKHSQKQNWKNLKCIFTPPY